MEPASAWPVLVLGLRIHSTRPAGDEMQRGAPTASLAHNSKSIFSSMTVSKAGTDGGEEQGLEAPVSSHKVS